MGLRAGVLCLERGRESRDRLVVRVLEQVALAALDLEQLAARLGTVRELVSRALGQLERAGAIKRSRSGVVIRDPGRLAEAARGGAPL